MTTQERTIAGHESDLETVAWIQARINKELGTAAVHEQRAKTEMETARVHKTAAQFLTQQVRAVLEKLGLPPGVDGYTTDWDRGVYRWEDADDNGGKEDGAEHMGPA